MEMIIYELGCFASIKFFTFYHLVPAPLSGVIVLHPLMLRYPDSERKRQVRGKIVQTSERKRSPRRELNQFPTCHRLEAFPSLPPSLLPNNNHTSPLHSLLAHPIALMLINSLSSYSIIPPFHNSSKMSLKP